MLFLYFLPLILGCGHKETAGIVNEKKEDASRSAKGLKELGKLIGEIEKIDIPSKADKSLNIDELDESTNKLVKDKWSLLLENRKNKMLKSLKSLSKKKGAKKRSFLIKGMCKALESFYQLEELKSDDQLPEVPPLPQEKVEGEAHDISADSPSTLPVAQDESADIEFSVHPSFPPYLPPANDVVEVVGEIPPAPSMPASGGLSVVAEEGGEGNQTTAPQDAGPQPAPRRGNNPRPAPNAAEDNANVVSAQITERRVSCRDREGYIETGKIPDDEVWSDSEEE